MRNRLVCLGLGILCGAATPCRAGTLRVDGEAWGQFRKNAALQREVPINTYLGAGVADLGKWHLGAATDLRFFRDLQRSIGDVDLYQGLVHAQPREAIQLDIGRQFVSQGFAAGVLDGVRTTVVPFDRLAVTAYAGMPRTVERGDFNRDDGLLSGLSFALRGAASTSAQVHVAWRKVVFARRDWGANDTVRLGVNLAHRFGGRMRPMAYGLFEYDAAGKVVEAGTVGIDLAPTGRVALNLEGNYFNADRATNRPTILALFTQGPLWTARCASTVTLVPGWLDVVERYAYQRVTPQAGLHRHGHLLEIAFPLTIASIGLAIEPAYYFEKSFGGRLHGGRLVAHEDFTDRLFADAGVDYVTYQKVTRDNDTGLSTWGWAGYEIVKGWRVAAGVEYNKNNAFNQDVRGTLQIGYHYGKKM